MPSTDERFDAWKRRPGDGALSSLLESVEPRILRICRRVLRDAHDAEEARQEVLLEVASGIGSIVDPSHFDRWVGRVAYRTAVDRRKMRRRRKSHESAAAAARTGNGNGHDDALHEAMVRLGDDDRELLIERYFDRRPLREMGARRGISGVAVRKRISKARGRLKRILGTAFGVGMVLVNAKAAAVILIFLLPILLLGGYRVSSSRRSSRENALLSPAVATPVATAPKLASVEPIRIQTKPTEAAQANSNETQRAKFLEDLKRYEAMSRRMGECSRESERLMRAGAWSKELSDEMQRLEKEMQALYRDLMKQVGDHPDVCLAFFNELEWSYLRKTIGWLLRPVIQAEIAEDGSRPGPILRALLPLARGSAQDRSYLLGLAVDLKTGVRELAEFCLEAMGDSDADNRYSGLHALSYFAQQDHLRDFFVEHKAKFQEIAKAARKDQPPVFAFLALAGIGSEDTDEFILRHWSAAQPAQQVYPCVAAMVRIAPRLAASQEHRIVPTLRHLLESEGVQHPGLVQLAFHLPRVSCVEMLRIASKRASPMEPGLAQGLENIIARIEAGETDAVIQEYDQATRKGAVYAYAIRIVGRVDLSKLK